MTSTKKIRFFLLVYFILFLSSQNVSFSEEYQKDLPDVSEKIGTKIDLNLTFMDDTGKLSTLADMFEDQPVLILTLNYFRCTTMCTYQFLNLATALQDGKSEVGKGYTIASISFDPTDDLRRAQLTRHIWIHKLGQETAPWHFYTTNNSDTINTLAKNLNFYFEGDDEGNFSHTAGLFFIDKNGTLKRYLYGIVYKPRDIKYALIDTSNGQVGTIFDKLARKFLKYNASRGKYEFYGS